MQGRDMTRKQIIRRAINLNKQLRALEDKARELAEAIEDYAFNGDKDNYNYDNYVYELRELGLTLEDLAGFDLEDSIPY